MNYAGRSDPAGAWFERDVDMLGAPCFAHRPVAKAVVYRSTRLQETPGHMPTVSAGRLPSVRTLPAEV